MSSPNAPINCLFCFSGVHTNKSQQQHQKSQKYLTTSDIIKCCRHISKEFIDSLKWTNVSSAAGSLCQECYNIAEKLNNLNINLDKILADISELASRLNIRISEERRNYEQSTQKRCGVAQNSKIIPVFGLVPNIIVSTEINDPENVKNGTGATDNLNDSNGSVFEALNSDVDIRDSGEKDEWSPGKAVKVNIGESRKSFARQKEILSTDATGEAVSQRDETITDSEPQRHTKDGLDKDFKCENCNKNFSTTATLKSHDCSKQTYECEVCNISFLTPRALKRHMLAHTSEKPYECEVCQKSFKYPNSLKKHMRSHTEEKPYNCEACDKSFSTSEQRKVHMRTHTGEKPYNCAVCNTSFSASGGLIMHMRSHTGERPYTCDICNKSYTTRQRLKRHERTHTGEKPYKCGTCGKCFSEQNDVKRHLRTHTDERPFKCTVCDSAFRHRYSLTGHLFTHEGTKDCISDICTTSSSSSKILKALLLSNAENQSEKCKISLGDDSMKEHTHSYHFSSSKVDKERWLETEEHDSPNKTKYLIGDDVCEEIKIEAENSTEFESFSSDDEDGQRDNENESDDGTQSSQKEENSDLEIKDENDLLLTHTEIKIEENVNNCANTTDSFISVNNNSDDTNGSIFEASISDGECQLSLGKPAKVNNRRNRKCFENQKEVLDGSTKDKTVSKRDEIVASESQRQTKDGMDADFKCGNCAKKFPTMTTLKSHNCSQLTYICKVCQLSFFTAAPLQIHMRTHTGEKPYECDVCQKSFAITASLKLHMKTHTGDKPYKCEVCQKSFAINSSLKLHMRTHTGEKPYKCEVCNKSFPRSGKLKDHMRTHTGEKPYKCEVCNTSFSKKGGRDRHMQTHTGDKPYLCEICSKSYALPGLLTMHMRSHTGEKPYECEVCQKSFAIARTLKLHMKTHTGEKPYDCEICKKSFAAASKLKLHMRTHMEKPYKCETCGKCFPGRNHLESHLLYTHGRETL